MSKGNGNSWMKGKLHAAGIHPERVEMKPGARVSIFEGKGYESLSQLYKEMVKQKRVEA